MMLVWVRLLPNYCLFIWLAMSLKTSLGWWMFPPPWRELREALLMSRWAYLASAAYLAFYGLIGDGLTLLPDLCESVPPGTWRFLNPALVPPGLPWFREVCAYLWGPGYFVFLAMQHPPKTTSKKLISWTTGYLCLTLEFDIYFFVKLFYFKF